VVQRAFVLAVAVATCAGLGALALYLGAREATSPAAAPAGESRMGVDERARISGASGEAREAVAGDPRIASAVPEVGAERELEASPAEGQREALPLPPGAALVLGADRSPIAGASVSRTRVEAFLPASTWGWDEIDPAWWSTASAIAQSDGRGRFAFEPGAGEDPAFGSVLWVDRPGFLATCELLAPETALDGREFVLAAQAPVAVLVLGPDGRPVEGALVEQHGVEIAGASHHDVPLHAAPLFQRSTSTDARGEARLAAFPGVQAVRARSGELLSRPHLIARRQERVTLVLGESFAVSGTLARPPTPPDVSGEIVPRVTFLALQGNLWRELGSAVGRKDESFGPLSVPIIENASLWRARVHGQGVASHSVDLAPPKPGEELRLHLEARSGATQWFFVEDVERQPLPGAEVRVTWAENGIEDGVVGRARPDGWVCMIGIRPGVVDYVISCAGYASVRVAAAEIPPPIPIVFTAALRRAGTVRGRVTREGVPEPDFEISYWLNQSPEGRVRRVFSDRADGTFELLDVPQSSIGLVAASPDCPGCEPVQVTVGPEGVEVELELLPALIGRGRVVEAGSGAPLASAILRPHVLGGLGPAGPWGAPLSVDAQGAFEARAFTTGQNYLTAEAPGYGITPVYAAAADGEVDFGSIELAPRVDLAVEVLPPIALVGAGYEISAVGPEQRTLTQLEPGNDGVLRGTFAGLSQGRYRVCFQGADLTFQYVYRDVNANPKPLRFLGGGGGTLRVTVPEPRNPALHLMLEYAGPDGADCWHISPFPDKGPLAISGIAPGSVIAKLREGEHTVAQAEVVLAAGETRDLELLPGGSSLRIRVVGSDGEPISSVRARLWLRASVASFHSGVTDEGGEVRFPALSAGAYQLQLAHATRGVLPNVDLAVASDEDVEREFRLDGACVFALRFADGKAPVAGATVQLLDPHGFPLLHPAIADADGRAAITKLAPGRYVLDAQAQGRWPLRVEVDVEPAAAEREFALPALGGLELRLLNHDAIPISGVEVELRYLPTGESVRDWIAAGRVSHGEALATDNHGKVLLEQIPHGSYAWEIAGSSGTLEVQAGETTRSLVSLP
jgi:hypothetical protein